MTPPATAYRRAAAAIAALLALVCSLGVASPVRAQSCYSHSSTCGCPGDLWLASTRGLGCGEGEPTVEHYLDDSGWQPSSVGEFLDSADDPSWVTCIFVHGNAYDACEARSKGMEFYRSLTRSSCCRQPVRFVIWSWPASRASKSLREDVLIKARRTNTEAVPLAEFVNRLPSDVPLSLIGYSYGARIVSGTLHLTGGGTLLGRSLAEPTPELRPPTRVVFLAAAMDSYWLRPGNFHGEAMSQIDKLTNLVNPDDRVLRFYPRFVSSAGAGAAGRVGIANGWLAEVGDRIAQIGVSNQIGKDHDLEAYMHTPGIMHRVRNDALYQDVELPIVVEPIAP